MRENIPWSRKALALAVITSLSAHASAQDNQVEEVVVTGSFIKGSPLDAPSPVQVVDRSSIEAQGAAVIWDVIKNLEVNSVFLIGKRKEWNIRWVFLFTILELKRFMKMLSIIQLSLEINTKNI